MTNLPKLAFKIGINCNAWIIGSAADPQVNLATVRDIDIIVPFVNWHQAAALIPNYAFPNTLGGWKVPDTIPLDIWPDDLSRVMASSKTKFLWHPFSDIRWSRNV